MKKAEVVIVGGSAAGIEAAITAQRQYNLNKLIVVRREEKALVPCGIPYIMGTLGSPEKDVMPASLLGDAELIVDEVTSINREAKSVSTSGAETIGYDRLVLATGSRPVVPPMPGADLENIFTIRKDIDYL
jgi:NADPH-dependent 2,4-dienoyl-CoA reductase/sulfur reductase-like enzyme